jgi:hypothetical protein
MHQRDLLAPRPNTAVPPTGTQPAEQSNHRNRPSPSQLAPTTPEILRNRPLLQRNRARQHPPNAPRPESLVPAAPNWKQHQCPANEPSRETERTRQPPRKPRANPATASRQKQPAPPPRSDLANRGHKNRPRAQNRLPDSLNQTTAEPTAKR